MRIINKGLPNLITARASLQQGQNLSTPVEHTHAMNLPKPVGNLLQNNQPIRVPVVTDVAGDYLKGLRYRNWVNIVETPTVNTAPIYSVSPKPRLSRVVIPIPGIGLDSIPDPDDGG